MLNPSKLYSLIAVILDPLLLLCDQYEKPNNKNPDFIEEGIISFIELLGILERVKKKQVQNINQEIINFLTNRWERIQFTPLCYTQYWDNPVTHVCEHLAKQLADDITPKNENYLRFLMPTIDLGSLDSAFESLTAGAVSESRIGTRDEMRARQPRIDHFIYTSSQKFFHVVDAIANGRNDGVPKFVNSRGEAIILSSQDKIEIASQSKAAKDLLEFIRSSELYNAISNLREALYEGCVTRHGEEMSAGEDANTGLVAFDEYLKNNLTNEQRQALFSLRLSSYDTTTFGRLYARMTTNVQDGDVENCANSLQSSIASFLQSQETNLRSLIEYTQYSTFNQAEQRYYREHQLIRKNGFNIYEEDGTQRLGCKIKHCRISSETASITYSYLLNDEKVYLPSTLIFVLKMADVSNYHLLLNDSHTLEKMKRDPQRFRDFFYGSFNDEQKEAIFNQFKKRPDVIRSLDDIVGLIVKLPPKVARNVFANWKIRELIKTETDLLDCFSLSFMNTEYINSLIKNNTLFQPEKNPKQIITLIKRFGKKTDAIFETIILNNVQRNMLDLSGLAELADLYLSDGNFFRLVREKMLVETFFLAIHDLPKLFRFSETKQKILLSQLSKEWWEGQKEELTPYELHELLVKTPKLIDILRPSHLRGLLEKALLSENNLLDFAYLNCEFVLNNGEKHFSFPFFFNELITGNTSPTESVFNLFKNNLPLLNALILKLVSSGYVYSDKKRQIINDAVHVLKEVIKKAYPDRDNDKTLPTIIASLSSSSDQVILIKALLTHEILNDSKNPTMIASFLGRITLYLTRDKIEEYITNVYFKYSPKNSNLLPLFQKSFLIEADCQYWNIIFTILGIPGAEEMTPDTYVKLSLDDDINPIESRPTLTDIENMIREYDANVGPFRRTSRMLFSFIDKNAGRTRIMAEFANFTTECRATLALSGDGHITNKHIRQIKSFLVERIGRFQGFHELNWMVNIMVRRSLIANDSLSTRVTRHTFGMSA